MEHDTGSVLPDFVAEFVHVTGHRVEQDFGKYLEQAAHPEAPKAEILLQVSILAFGLDQAVDSQ